MSTPVAIVIAAVILAAALSAAILITFRYEVVDFSKGYPVLLDRWTGRVTLCTEQSSDRNPYAGIFPGGDHGGTPLRCRP